MPKLSKVEQAISVLRVAAQKKTLSEGQLSEIASLAELAEGTRPAVEGALSEKNAEKPTGILGVLEKRLGQEPNHYKRPEGITFPEVKAALEKNSALMASLSKMEEAGGAPDIIGVQGDTFVFADCSVESPSGHRNLDYYQSAKMAKGMGVDMLSEADYRMMQKKGKFDLDNWIWLESEDVIDAGDARRGGRDGAGVGVVRVGAGVRYPREGWRASLRVPKAKNQK